MFRSANARWLLLSEARHLFADDAPWRAFVDLLTGGQIRVCGKRGDRLNAEPIETLLRRAAGASSIIDLSIDSATNRVTITGSKSAWYKAQYAGLLEPVFSNNERANLDDILGGHGLEAVGSHMAFRDVRVEKSSLIDAAEAAGFSITRDLTNTDEYGIAIAAAAIAAAEGDQASVPRPKRGPAPVKRMAAVTAMIKKVQDGVITAECLGSMTDEALMQEFGLKRDTAREARKIALLALPSILRQTPISNK